MLLYIFFFLCCAASIHTSLVINDLEYKAEITKSLVYIKIRMDIENPSHEDIHEFFVTLPAKEYQYLSQIYAFSPIGEKFNVEIHDPKNSSKEIKYLPSQLDSYTIFKVPFKILKHSSINWTLEYALGNYLRAAPSSLDKSVGQVVVYETYDQIPTVYPCKAQSILFTILPNSFKYSNRKLKFVGSQLQIEQPIKDVKPFSLHEATPVRVYLNLNKPLGYIKDLERQVDTSHWGTSQVHEHCTLRNGGAKFIGEFHSTLIRYHKHQNVLTNELYSIDTYLPKTVKSVEYFDESGNISTSELRREENAVVMKIMPRFVLMGGWETDWHLRYSLPSESVIRRLSEASTYELTIPFGPGYVNTYVENYNLKIALPPGAKILEVAFPRAVPSHQITFTNFWGWGDLVSPRPSIHIHLDRYSQRLSDVMKHNIQITYVMKDSIGLKPIQYSLVILLLFFGMILVHRLSWIYLIKTSAFDLDATRRLLENNKNAFDSLRSKLPSIYSEQPSIEDWDKLLSHQYQAEKLMKEVSPAFNYLSKLDDKRSSELRLLTPLACQHLIGYTNHPTEQSLIEGIRICQNLMNLGIQIIDQIPKSDVHHAKSE